jgi:hypothetical protein
MSVFLFFNWNTAAVVTEFMGRFDPGTAAISELLVIFTVTPLTLCFFLFLILSTFLPDGGKIVAKILPYPIP